MESIPPRHPPEEERFPEAADVGAGADIRLGDDADAVAGGEEELADHGDAHIWAVHVTVSRYQDDVEGSPAAGADLFRGDG